MYPQDSLSLDASQMTDLDGIPLRQAHNGFQIYLPVTKQTPKGAVIRRKISNV
jgi:hypothetical protein